MKLAGGLLLALLSTAALSYGFYLQHSAASRLPALTVRRPLASLTALFSNRPWVAGFATGLGGWGLYIVALWLAPLSLVQATSAGGVGLLALLAHVGGVPLSTREQSAVGLAVGGLLLLGLSLPAGAHSAMQPWPAPLAWILASMLGAVAAGSVVAKRVRPGAGLAAAAGLLYAAGDVATKAAVGGTSPVAVFALLLPLSHGLAFICIQAAFQRGSVLATAGVSSLLTNVLPIFAGVIVFNEHMPGGAAGVLRGLGFAGAAIGASLLAGKGSERPAPPQAERDAADQPGPGPIPRQRLAAGRLRHHRSRNGNAPHRVSSRNGPASSDRGHGKCRH
jgi:hypothetical protein